MDGYFVRPSRWRDYDMTRMGDAATIRSTVRRFDHGGFFEVDPATGQLGQELHSDTGDVRRHGAFYMIDRSIPVAFEPGTNHNVDRAAVLRRFIEGRSAQSNEIPGRLLLDRCLC
jgi:hypothetical protein